MNLARIAALLRELADEIDAAPAAPAKRVAKTRKVRPEELPAAPAPVRKRIPKPTSGEVALDRALRKIRSWDPPKR